MISFYRGHKLSWKVLYDLCPTFKSRAFGIMVGRIWIGVLWRTNVPIDASKETT